MAPLICRLHFLGSFVAVSMFSNVIAIVACFFHFQYVKAMHWCVGRISTPCAMSALAAHSQLPHALQLTLYQRLCALRSAQGRCKSEPRVPAAQLRSSPHARVFAAASRLHIAPVLNAARVWKAMQQVTRQAASIAPAFRSLQAASVERGAAAVAVT
jgi:hypothetical protein